MFQAASVYTVFEYITQTVIVYAYWLLVGVISEDDL